MTEATPRLDQRLGECGVIGPVEGFETPVQRRTVDRAIPQRVAIEKPRRHNAEPCPFLASWRGKLRAQRHSDLAGRPPPIAAIEMGARARPTRLPHGGPRARRA